MSKSSKKKKDFPFVALFCVMAVCFCALFLSSGEDVSRGGELFHLRGLSTAIIDSEPKIVAQEGLNLKVEAVDEGDVVFYSSQGFYRYGPSIIENGDGSYDAWFSAPGNSSSQWDYITYRHSEDGVNWSKEKTVLKPTPSSKDQCSVCDPGVIYFDGYYYLAYTSTDDYGHGGNNNSAFVARSRKPDGPYEKWNGKGWGGKPYPILSYEGDPRGWGIGEVSFVKLEKDLYLYYTYFDTSGGYTSLAKAEVCEDWPLTIEEKGVVMGRTTQDSLDVFYAEDLKVFVAFSIQDRMAESSKLAIYTSLNGQSFEKSDATKLYIEDYAHNLGVAKSKEGHQNTEDAILLGYAYGRRWGRWNLKFQEVVISNPVAYKIIKS